MKFMLQNVAAAVLAVGLFPSVAWAQNPGAPVGPPEQDPENRRDRIDRLENQIRELEKALKSDDTSEERRAELAKKLDDAKVRLKEAYASRPRQYDPTRDQIEMRELESDIAKLESALGNKDTSPEQRKQLTDQLDYARARLRELHSVFKAQDRGWWSANRPLSAKVTAIAADLDLTIISAGRDAGVTEGDEFSIHRGEVFVGKIVIDRVDRAWSSGRIVLKGKESPQVGDTASRNVLARGGQDPRGGPVFDPELHKLSMAARELEVRSMEISAKLRKLPAESKEAREELKGLLVETVVELFDLREKARAREVEMIKKRLDELTQLLEKRKANRKAIIEKRVQQLSGESDELDW